MWFVLGLLVHGEPFGYEDHGADWGGGCATRTAQSPVNIPDIYGPSSGHFEVNYSPVSEFEVVSGGGQLRAVLPPGNGNGVVLNGQGFVLEEVSFHSPSEHTLGGKRAALEVQLQHSMDGSLQRAHVAVLFDAPEAAALLQQEPADFEQPELDPAAAEVREVDALTAASGAVVTLARANETVELYTPPSAADPGYAASLAALLAEPLPIETLQANTSWDLKALVQSAEEFYSYAGSRSVPPCEERVQWLVSRHPKSLSAAQLSAFKAALELLADNGNWRVVMPFNERKVDVVSAVRRVAPVEPTESPEDEERKFIATQAAEDAVTIATAAKQYARDLDQRLRTASIAHLKGFLAPVATPPPPPAEPAPVETAPKGWLDQRTRDRTLQSTANQAVAAVARKIGEDHGPAGVRIAQAVAVKQLGYPDMADQLYNVTT